ncbi:prepilin-type N-terminal cleavage/methylation domain-containing protein [Hydrogenispora ethanolica]|uniref:Prepilin-type N-terminal cleavage/methylation domain-containing protein n=1 Tax=Hydrogenispora ethanolica TaxID=1082276 RepID=A0A4R1RMD4_HYDET|nr:prepilin-type N-terminal cleavage/methylation domain-containing protein [Hydrogenispora ethanolica]TCL67428.1 prepilin-type N-terminal cleavage/methylation domain-containing protein [Hydrogenispora ethanolica]
MPQHSNVEKGFSLVEVLMAMLLFAAAVLMLASYTIATSRSQLLAKRMDMAAAKAANEIEKCKTLASQDRFTEIEGQDAWTDSDGFEILKDVTDLTLDNAGNMSLETESPSLKRVKVTVTYYNDNDKNDKLISVTQTTLISSR